MTTRPTDNAFPLHSTDFFDEKPIGSTTHHGLSKREYFAAIALQGLLASTHWEFCKIDDVWEHQAPSLEDFAEIAVEQADKLIEELSISTRSLQR
ncbi:hypothetical protein C7B65_15130 [Phormidesmis priestleyi ULC007]|uniref:Uncharacterized protein n=1 Tax=Phormidesmis priestleyi ULC007 TaxID=1920490 RepID=A0A2T1DD72_9CYAN|nr:hypothetical protein [Phormidesmis priestleyi]PSB18425.1 hypothetical protein C7B65_15130 [Phormidesmis priestleyi ULC007]PZO48848.1 MAG: hypothetical protein DCF14_16060 [Phormidesmis priestleyi]